MILKLIPTKWLWEEIYKREKFLIVDKIESNNIWQDVFNKSPILKDWMKKREVMILREVLNDKKNNDFILGKISELRMYMSFDIPSLAVQKVAETKEKPFISKENFLKKWTKKDADTK
jgi:hypothetical protein